MKREKQKCLINQLYGKVKIEREKSSIYVRQGSFENLLLCSKIPCPVGQSHGRGGVGREQPESCNNNECAQRNLPYILITKEPVSTITTSINTTNARNRSKSEEIVRDEKCQLKCCKIN